MIPMIIICVLVLWPTNKKYNINTFFVLLGYCFPFIVVIYKCFNSKNIAKKILFNDLKELCTGFVTLIGCQRIEAQVLSPIALSVCICCAKGEPKQKCIVEHRSQVWNCPLIKTIEEKRSERLSV